MYIIIIHVVQKVKRERVHHLHVRDRYFCLYVLPLVPAAFLPPLSLPFALAQYCALPLISQPIREAYYTYERKNFVRAGRRKACVYARQFCQLPSEKLHIPTYILWISSSIIQIPFYKLRPDAVYIATHIHTWLNSYQLIITRTVLTVSGRENCIQECDRIVSQYTKVYVILCLWIGN